ncbi:hypothetical protein PLEOSDRAFT_168579 [Pleurotus ostreatus PC15]|uniref:Uncharacterized protein n=1 Tax=Pleurotus ostreatus (strain PC15) TaxID=1137138 RepID=A0A067NGT4_PLEO1|nr:hypothetical protein PLEOSDRAFT_168579 [Pleurotus ostreatus PC15]
MCAVLKTVGGVVPGNNALGMGVSDGFETAIQKECTYTRTLSLFFGVLLLVIPVDQTAQMCSIASQQCLPPGMCRDGEPALRRELHRYQSVRSTWVGTLFKPGYTNYLPTST